MEDNENSFLASSYTILSNPTTACCHAFTIPMMIRFALDWNYATGENLFKNEAYFRTDLKKKTDVRRDKERPAWPDPELEGSQVGMQIIASEGTSKI